MEVKGLKPRRAEPVQRRYTVVDTPVGPVRVTWTPRGICGLVLMNPGPDRGGMAAPAPAPGEPAPGACRDDGRRAELQALLRAWFAGDDVDVPVDRDAAGLSPFVRAVLEEVRRIPRGRVRTYGEIARALGRPGAARAVGNAVAANPVALLIPCHRVVPAGGGLGQYSGGGPQVKERLLRLEGGWPPAPSPDEPGRAKG